MALNIRDTCPFLLPSSEYGFTDSAILENFRKDIRIAERNLKREIIIVKNSLFLLLSPPNSVPFLDFYRRIISLGAMTIIEIKNRSKLYCLPRFFQF